ncbi:MAG TPA: hypothetical protein VKU85_19125, partial [bacterium]|nr:hypothetical protein [bacterium]
ALAALVLLSVGLPLPAVASSRYSLRGEGEATLPQRADARALGGAEAAADIPSLTGNPASLVFTQDSRFYGSWETEWIRAEETLPTENPVAKDYSGYVPNLGLVFPLRNNLTLGLGLLVERRVDARIELPRTVTDGPNYTQVFEATGNHLRIPVGLAWNHPRVQVGSTLDLLLVNSERRWRNDFEPGSEFTDSNDLVKRHLFGVGWRVGARVPVTSRVALGGWLSLPGNVDGDLRFENDDNDDSDDLVLDLEAELPVRYAVGLELRPTDRWRVAGDWVHEDWEGAEPADTADVHVNVDRFAVGVEWGERGDSWPARIGYRTEPLHVLDDHDPARAEEIREHAVSLGSGFGFAGGRGVLDGYLEYGWRGVADESEYYEQFVRFGLTLTGFEEWSLRRPPEAEEDW